MNCPPKRTPVSDRKCSTEKLSGKKLVQARLPFKIISATTSAAQDDKTDSKHTESIKKRRLSYLDDSPNSNQIVKTNSNTESFKRNATSSIPCEVIVIPDDNINVDSTKCLPKKTLVVKLKRLSKSETYLHNVDIAGISSMPHLNAKRDSKGLPKCSSNAIIYNSDSSFPNEGGNPPKKRKLAEYVTSYKDAEIINRDLTTGRDVNLISEVSLSDDEEMKEVMPRGKKDEISESNEDLTSSKLLSTSSPNTDQDTSNEALSKSEVLQNLTPKQQKLLSKRKELREEKERKLQEIREERKRKQDELREERERKAQEEKAQKQKEREERELQKKLEREKKDELKRREKEEKEEQRRKEKEERDRKRQAEVDAKNEEKRKKDEAKEEEKRKKEEEEAKKKKAAEAFTKFFVPKAIKPSVEPDSETTIEKGDKLAFRPFQIKGSMKLAPFVRRDFNAISKDKLDSYVNSDSKGDILYLDELKNGQHVPLHSSKTIIKDLNEDVMIIETELEAEAQTIDETRPKDLPKYRAKFYSFKENRRPPYYGTWRKRSTIIRPRRPFALDKKFFDYDVDSDEEWEDDEPGESLNGSEDEKESEDEDYEVDNDWFVPHGHLSDEELQNEDELSSNVSREAQQAKLKALQYEFAMEMKKKTEKLRPRLIGVIWENENGEKPEFCSPTVWDRLCSLGMIVSENPILEEQKPSEPEAGNSQPKKLEFTDELMQNLIRLIHGNRHKKSFLIEEYIEYLRKSCDTIKNGTCVLPTKSFIREKIDEIAEWSVLALKNGKKKIKKKLCWVVSADVLDKYSLSALEIPNDWSYNLKPKHEKEKNNEEMKSTPTTKGTTTSGITKFTKLLTKDEKHALSTRAAKHSKPPDLQKTIFNPKGPAATITAKETSNKIMSPTHISKQNKSKNDETHIKGSPLIAKFLGKAKTPTLESSSTGKPLSETETSVNEVICIE